MGGEYVDNSSTTTKGFIYSYSTYDNYTFRYLISTGTRDIVNKVAYENYFYFGAGKSGTGSSASFFLLKSRSIWEGVQMMQIGADTSSVDPTSEISKSLEI